MVPTLTSDKLVDPEAVAGTRHQRGVTFETG